MPKMFVLDIVIVRLTIDLGVGTSNFEFEHI